MPHRSSAITNGLTPHANLSVCFFIALEVGDESTAAFWQASGQMTLRNQLLRENNNNSARNIIFFLGDGMSIPTVTAARIYAGQLRGQRGEEAKLSFEKFPYIGLSKVCKAIKEKNDICITKYSL